MKSHIRKAQHRYESRLAEVVEGLEALQTNESCRVIAGLCREIQTVADSSVAIVLRPPMTSESSGENTPNAHEALGTRNLVNDQWLFDRLSMVDEVFVVFEMVPMEKSVYRITSSDAAKLCAEAFQKLLDHYVFPVNRTVWGSPPEKGGWVYASSHEGEKYGWIVPS